MGIFKVVSIVCLSLLVSANTATAAESEIAPQTSAVAPAAKDGDGEKVTKKRNESKRFASNGDSTNPNNPDWDKPITGFHPIRKMIRPVWKLRREAQDLESEIVALQVPMNSLPPAFATMNSRIAGLENKIGTMSDQLIGLNKNLDRLSSDLNKISTLNPAVIGVQKELQGISKLREDIREVTKVREDVRAVSRQMEKLNKPLNDLKQPMIEVAKPLSGVATQVASVNGKMTTVEEKVVEMQERMDGLSQQLNAIKQPVSSITSPLTAVRDELQDLNKLLIAVVTATCLSVIAGLIGVMVTITLAYRFRHTVVAVLTNAQEVHQQSELKRQEVASSRR